MASGRHFDVIGRDPGWLRQSVVSNYCGVYSTANALRFCGIAMTRRQILRVFRATGSVYPGATHDEIRDVFSDLTGAGSARWESRDALDARWLLRRVRQQLAATPVTLISFGALYARRYHGIHVVAVVNAGRSSLEVIDPLSRAGTVTTKFDLAAGRVSTPGPYTISGHEPAAVLLWTPR